MVGSVKRRTTLSGTDLLGAGSRTIAQPPRRFLVFVFQAGWLKPLLQAVSGSCAAFPALKSRVHCPAMIYLGRFTPYTFKRILRM